MKIPLLLLLAALILSLSAAAQKPQYGGKIFVERTIRKGYDTSWNVHFQSKADPKRLYVTIALSRHALDELSAALVSLLKVDRSIDTTISLKSGVQLGNYGKGHIALISRDRKYIVIPQKKVRKLNVRLKKAVSGKKSKWLFV